MCIWRVSINKHNRIQVAGFIKLIVLYGGFLFMMHCADNVGHEYQIEAVNAKTSPIIDGNLDEPVWQQAEPVLLKENRSGINVTDKQLMTRVMTCYDDSTLYIAFDCNDPDIWANYTQRDEYLWQEEAVEVFLDVDEEPDTYVEIEVSPANVLFDSYIVDPEKIDVPATAKFDLPGIKTAVSLNGTLNIREDTDTGWTVEIAVPFRDLVTEKNTNITIDTIVKINFYRVDKNQDMNSAGYAWSPTGARFHKPSVFGTLIFKESQKDR